MLQTLIKKLCIYFTGIFILVTCTACGVNTPSYTVKEYLNDLAIKSGLNDTEDIGRNIESLVNWKIIDGKNINLDDKVDYGFLCDTLGRFLQLDQDSYTYFKTNNYINEKTSRDDLVNKEEAHHLIDRVIEEINNIKINKTYAYEYRKELKDNLKQYQVGDLIIEDNTYKIITEVEGDNYSCQDAKFEEVFSYFEIEDSYEIDFTDALIIPYYEDEIIYQNLNYNLLSSNNHVFHKDGFRVSYTVNASGVHVHVSKDIEGLNVYLDLDVNNIKPTIKWKYEDNDLKNCFFKVDMNTTEKLGVSDGRYGNYYLNFKDLDASSFAKMYKSIVKPVKDQGDISIPICKIKTPIPNVPTANICLDLLIKLYASGKAEIVIYNQHQVGFETKDGNVRFIKERSDDFDFIINATSKAAAGINVSLEAATYSLADIELDTGLKAQVKSTIHLYDEDGKMNSYNDDATYSALQDISKENENVKICGDLSLHWLMDLNINSSKTQLSRLGLSKSYHVLDDDNQVFNNLHHLENGHFVEKCTRKDKSVIKTMDKVESHKIVLESYAEVLNLNESYQIVVKALPAEYLEKDLIYQSMDNSIATVNNGLIKPISPGSVKIEVKTKDDKYKAYVNILVSTG